MTFNLYKTIIACVALVCVTVLMVTGKMTEGVGQVLIASILFYCLGNGIAATSKSGTEVEPLIGRKKPPVEP